MGSGTLEQARQLARERRWPELAALACPVPDESMESHPELAYLLGDALRRTGDFDRSLALATVAARGADRVGDGRLSLRALNLLGMLAFDAGELDRAKDLFEQLLDRSGERGDDEFAARASNNLGVIASVRGERELALTTYQRAIAAYQRLGYSRGLAQSHYNLGLVYRDMALGEESERNFVLALQFSGEHGNEDVVALVETERALLLAASGDGPLAEKIAEKALEGMRRLGDPLGAANAVRALASAARVSRRPLQALQRLEEALSTVDSYPDLLLRAEIQRDRGALLLETGDRASAIAALEDSLASFQTLGAAREAEATSLLLSRLS